MRKIIQISGNDKLTALCDDGSLWGYRAKMSFLDPDNTATSAIKFSPAAWIRLPDIEEKDCN